MDEVNSKSVSISFRVDDGIIEHNNREIIAKNVDPARISDNITYTKIEIKQFYEQIFGEALAEYNAKQKRADRQIPDYYEHIKKSGKGKLFYEIVVQFGDLHDCGVGSEKWETAKQMLDEYMSDFEKRNSNLKVFNAVMHLDESTPHLHIDFVPVAHKGQRGLSLKNSMSGALREQGFSSSNKMQNEWTAWSESERSVMEKILRKHGLSRDDKNIHREHLSVDDYKQYAVQKSEVRKINEHINELKKKNSVDLTSDEIELIKNQNDIMRSEIQKRDEKISSLSRKLGAKFVPFDIFSEEKLQYVAAELDKIGVPVVEENNTLHIPDYAQKTAAAIAASFRPTKAESVREKIKLDIDRLVYCAADLDDLISKLGERGYEIKHGKYLAIKSPFAERFVRLKTLGEAYVPKNLEKRIADRDKFPNAVREKFKTANHIEKKFHITVMDMVIEIKQFTLLPRKLDPKKIYAFQNDAEINYLSEQLCTIRDFGFVSREQMYDKAAELQDYINNNPKREIEQQQLKRISELIKAYEAIVEGNHIDNLIKAQNKQKQEHTPKHSR